MDSSYSLPSSALPHAHMHSHAHSQSQSSLNSWRSSVSNGSLHSHPEDDHHEGQGPGGYASNTSRARIGSGLSQPAAVLREKMPPPQLDAMDGWTKETTLGGKDVLTPGPGTVTTPYSPPKMHRMQTSEQLHTLRDNHSDSHEHSYGHSPSHSHDHRHSHAHSLDHGHGHSHDHSHDREHSHDHGHSHDHPEHEARSFVTRSILPYVAGIPLLHQIIAEKDSRRIFYFMMLNFSFMAVQFFYGFVTDSLGLLSDSIHMFFDCLALAVGLVASVMSKWPPSQKFPYGFGKMETLSGFANGILLVLISVEIIFEAFERFVEGSHTKRLMELAIVSTLGFLVNAVGLLAFGHHHHHGGHDHGHEHHHHGHPHEKEGHGHDASHSHGHHHHHHDNENMRGIYLHIMADLLGSVSVIVSTGLTYIWDWSGWDPLASVFIAVMIGGSAIPLVTSSARRLLLNVPEDIEYNLRNVLSGISQQRGVVSYAAPKFWTDDRSGGGKLVGVVHIVVAQGASLDDARKRVRSYLSQEGIDAVIQAEREGDAACWCSRGWASAILATPSGGSKGGRLE